VRTVEAETGQEDVIESKTDQWRPGKERVQKRNSVIEKRGRGDSDKESGTLESYNQERRIGVTGHCRIMKGGGNHLVKNGA
jgi:hypothetical protein